jgi:hypothetical protein
MLRFAQEMAFQMEFQKYSTFDKGKSTFFYTLKQLCHEVDYIVPNFFWNRRYMNRLLSL